MANFTNPLDNIKVASPCSADWEAMLGNNRQRYCGECKLNVYNLSGMSRREAENLLIRSEGRLCVRYFRRPDGTILTQDCPVGWQAVRKRMSRYWTAVFSVVFGFFTGFGLNTFFSRAEHVYQPEMGAIPAEYVDGNATIPVEEKPVPLMGTMAVEPVEKKGEVSNFEEVRRNVLKNQRR